MPQYPDRRPSAHRVWRRMDVAERVMERLDIDRAALARLDNGAALTQIMRNCITCKYVDECRIWLNTADSPGAPPPNCPNRDLLIQCASEAATTSQNTAIPKKKRT